MHKNGAQSVRRTRQGKEISRRERSRSELRRAHRRCEVKNISFFAFDAALARRSGRISRFLCIVEVQRALQNTRASLAISSPQRQ